MKTATRLVSLVALLATHFCCPAGASDYEVGKSLVCDTQGQVERFVALFTGDASAAIRVVNAESLDPTACAIVNVAYMRGPSIGMARHGDNAFEIVRILVVGVETERGPAGQSRRLLLAVWREGIRDLNEAGCGGRDGRIDVGTQRVVQHDGAPGCIEAVSFRQH
jgi:hypothetical protein